VAFRAYVPVQFLGTTSDSAFWAKPKHIDRAKKLVVEGRTNGDPLKPSFQLGNIPLYNCITSVITFGAPEYGKSFGILNYLAFEHLREGGPMCMLDLQYPEQTSRFVAIAQSLGYHPDDIHVFAPGEEESEVWNICEGLEGSAALERAALMQDNAARDGKHRQSDDFFTPGVRLLLAGSMSLVRHVPGLDNLLGCRALFTFKDLLARLDEHRDKLEKIDPWALAMFDQYRASEDSPQTAASLAASTLAFLSIYGDKTLAPSIVGKTSFPLKLEGKKLLIIGCRPENRVTVAPLITALLSQIVEANAVPGRTDALQIAIDEAFAINYKRLVTDVNENRKYGVYFNIACQNFSQIKEKFSEDKLRSLMTGFGTKFWFNPNELESAKYLESILGIQKYRKRNYTYQSKGGGSSSTSEQERKLFPVQSIMKMQKTQVVAFCYGISSETEANIPWKTSVKVSSLYKDMYKWAETQWPFTQERLIERSPQIPADDILRITREAAETLLPAPKSNAQKSIDEELRQEQEDIDREDFEAA
jgi:type IV secretory pathway TraG/TraD family ATPase VirD4